MLSIVGVLCQEHVDSYPIFPLAVCACDAHLIIPGSILRHTAVVHSIFPPISMQVLVENSRCVMDDSISYVSELPEIHAAALLFLVSPESHPTHAILKQLRHTDRLFCVHAFLLAGVQMRYQLAQPQTVQPPPAAVAAAAAHAPESAPAGQARPQLAPRQGLAVPGVAANNSPSSDPSLRL